MKVMICQTNPVLLDIQANLEDVIGKIRKGREEDADLVVFPELALTGYFLGDQYHQAALRMNSGEIRRLASATKGTAAVVGFVEESPAMNFYNSALVAVDGKVAFAYRKLNMPNYGVFEERKYFSPGKHVPVFHYHGFTIAVFICNDVWHPSLPYLGVCQKADIFVTILNSTKDSMGTEFNNQESWEIINTFYARIFGIYNVCANRVGEETFLDREIAKAGEAKGKVIKEACSRFWGGSEIINPFGKRIAKAALDEPDAITGEISRDLLRKKRILLPYLRNDDPYFTHRELGRVLFDHAGPVGPLP